MGREREKKINNRPDKKRDKEGKSEEHGKENAG